MPAFRSAPLTGKARRSYVPQHSKTTLVPRTRSRAYRSARRYGLMGNPIKPNPRARFRSASIFSGAPRATPWGRSDWQMRLPTVRVPGLLSWLSGGKR